MFFGSWQLFTRGEFGPALGIACISGLILTGFVSAAQNGKRRFTVADDIAVTQLSRTVSDNPGHQVSFSPDGRYFWVLADRGRLDIDRAESSLRIYRVSEIAGFLIHPEREKEPTPFWTITRATFKYGPILDHVRWLKSSRGLAFLCRTVAGNNQLILAPMASKETAALTPESQNVTGFDVEDARNFVYAVSSQAPQIQDAEETHRAVTVGTGRSLRELLHTRDIIPQYDLSELWAVINGKRFRVTNKITGHSVPIHWDGATALALSPLRHAVVTAMTVPDVPSEWEALFPPPSPLYPFRVRSGRQDPLAFNGRRDLSEFVLLDLFTGEAKSLTNAPIGFGAGWFGISGADWSSDGRSVVLSNTFLADQRSQPKSQPRQPCVVVVDFSSQNRTCLELPSTGGPRHRILGAEFSQGSKDSVTISYGSGSRELPEVSTFCRQMDGSWKAVAKHEIQSGENHNQISIFVDESINEPPHLTAMNNRSDAPHTIWDPNPQLQAIKFGETSIYQWRDNSGREWVGGLYKPADYVEGLRYPLVIQAGSFSQHEFYPSGSYPTAFAAQELAAAGFVVLQVENCPLRETAEEARCQVAGYESAVDQLAKDGLVEADRVGMVGFSRNCHYVLETLTKSKLKLKAASITDGSVYSYWQYIMTIGIDGQNSYPASAEAIIGAPPFGVGLSRWLERSPGFNLDKVGAPLLVAATSRPLDILTMWDTYAQLDYLDKPVDFVIWNSQEHVFTNPRLRLLSQGNTVDWFRFWLQNYEDPDPSKVEQYERWRRLKLLR